MKTKVTTTSLFVVFFSATLSLSAQAAPMSAENAKLCAKNGTDLPFLENRKIKITDYRKETDSFTAIAVDFPGEGSSFVTLDGLAQGIAMISMKVETIKADPESILDHTYVNEKKVPTLDEDENAARKVCGKK